MKNVHPPYVLDFMAELQNSRWDDNHSAPDG